jgi:Universal stress protein family
MLVVGTRGRSLGGFQGLLPGSISKYCLQNSPIPVIVVRPNAQRARSKRKRQADPSLQEFRDLLDKSGTEDHFKSISQDQLEEAAEDEAAAVLAAIGLTAKEIAAQRQSPLSQVHSAEDSPSMSKVGTNGAGEPPLIKLEDQAAEGSKS